LSFGPLSLDFVEVNAFGFCFSLAMFFSLLNIENKYFHSFGVNWKMERKKIKKDSGKTLRPTTATPFY